MSSTMPDQKPRQARGPTLHMERAKGTKLKKPREAEGL